MSIEIEPSVLSIPKLIQCISPAPEKATIPIIKVVFFRKSCDMNPTEKGFTLLEVLIAVVIFSVGLLGLAGLHITNLKLSHDSLLRSTATILAKDMADRMRANVSQVNLGLNSLYNNPTGTATANPACIAKDTSGNVLDTSCTPAQMALHDFYEWQSQITGQVATSWHPAVISKLPSGQGIVCIDSTPFDGAPPPGDPACDNIEPTPGRDVFTIKIWWNERKDSLNPATRQFIMSVAI